MSMLMSVLVYGGIVSVVGGVRRPCTANVGCYVGDVGIATGNDIDIDDVGGVVVVVV